MCSHFTLSSDLCSGSQSKYRDNLPAPPCLNLQGFEHSVFIQLLSRGIKHGPFGYHTTQENSIHPLQNIDSLDEMTLLYVIVSEFPSLLDVEC